MRSNRQKYGVFLVAAILSILSLPGLVHGQTPMGPRGGAFQLETGCVPHLPSGLMGLSMWALMTVTSTPSTQPALALLIPHGPCSIMI